MNGRPEFGELLVLLNDVLAELYPNKDDARRIVTLAGMPSGNIEFADAPRLNWFNVLQEARKRKTVGAIVKVARREYPDRPEWSGLPNELTTARTRALPVAGMVGLAVVVVGLAAFAAWFINDRRPGEQDRNTTAATNITGHLLFQNSDSVVKGAIVRLPDASRKSDPTDEAGFFRLDDVPQQTPTLFVLVSGKLHELTVVNQPGFRYRVVPPVADPPKQLDSVQATAVMQLATKQPNRFRIEGPGRRASILWPNGRAIQISFLDGSEELQSFVRRAAAEWARHANITFQFQVDQKTADVRVSFKEPAAYSFRGTDALGVSKQNPTMVLGALTPGSAANMGIALHELGHVLGLVHEYQNPQAGSLFDWETIYAKAARPPLHWSRQTVDMNLRPPANLPKEYENKPFDAESVMMSLIPDDWFKNAIKLEPRTTMSAGDRAFIAQLYPN